MNLKKKHLKDNMEEETKETRNKREEKAFMKA